MPCYQVRIVSIQFKIGNADLLKKALNSISMRVEQNRNIFFVGKKNSWSSPITIDLATSTIQTSSLTRQELSIFSNQIKRAYSKMVINEVAKEKKWMVKKISETRGQLIRH